MDTTLRVETTDRLHMTRAERRRCLSPKDLCKHRGIAQSDIGAGVLFVDDLLGYAIYREPRVAATGTAPSSEPGWQGSPTAVANFRIDLEPEKEQEWPERMLHWYLAEANGRKWPRGTGKGQCVAVLDSGIDSGIATLPRRPDHADFCSCSEVAQKTNAIDIHGTQCAGTIAARAGSDRMRRTVAPDCRLIAAQVQRRHEGLIRPETPLALTTLIDVLLMLSWAIHRWSARVISMSFRANIAGVNARRDILGEIAMRLRRLDEALIFASAEEHPRSLSYPASAAGVVAVGGYSPRASATTLAIETLHIRKRSQLWATKNDLLFAPCERLSTVVPPDTAVDNFSGSSGACAFAAGVAALYMEAYPDLTVEEILDLMKGNATKIPRKESKYTHWPALRFPRRGPAGALRRLFWNCRRRVRRKWREATEPDRSVDPAPIKPSADPANDLAAVGAKHAP